MLRLIVPLYLLYAALFILHSSHVVQGCRYFTLFDDGMISMRYAHNLADGFGLVWNRGGERVEGFTNLLWVLYMTPFHLLPVSASKLSLFIQISGGVLLALNLYFVMRIAGLLFRESAWTANCAVFVTAAYYPLSYWGLLGMEVSLLIAITSFCAWKTLEEKSPRLVYILLAVATLTRLDMAPLFVVFLAYNWLARKADRSQFLFGLFLLILTVAGQIAFRLAYFGDPLPNTYYLKMSGYPAPLRIARGAVTAFSFLVKNWIVFLLAGWAVFRKASPDRRLLAALFAVQFCYSVYVGGDAWEEWGGSNRFLSVAMPMVFILFCLGAWELAIPLPRRFFSASFANPRTLILAMVAILNLNAMYGPKAWLEWALIRPMETDTIARRMIQLALITREVAKPTATAATALAGIFPYFYEGPVIDLLGKNDRFIAHQEMHAVQPGILTFYPGHMKWDNQYAIVQKQPDIVGPLWAGSDDVAGYLEEHYLQMSTRGVQFYVRKNSPNIDWTRLRKLPSP